MCFYFLFSFHFFHSSHSTEGDQVRSVTPYSLYTPHTGMMSYRDGVKKIPTASVTVEDALMMSRMQSRGTPMSVQLYMEANGDSIPEVSQVREKRMTREGNIVQCDGRDHGQSISQRSHCHGWSHREFFIGSSHQSDGHKLMDCRIVGMWEREPWMMEEACLYPGKLSA